MRFIGKSVALFVLLALVFLPGGGGVAVAAPPASSSPIPLNIVSLMWVGGACNAGESGTLSNLFDGDYSTNYVCSGFTSPSTARIELRLAAPVEVGYIRLNSHSSWCVDGTAFVSYWITPDFGVYTRPGQVSIVQPDVWYSVAVNSNVINLRIYPSVGSSCGNMFYAKEIELFGLNPYATPMGWPDVMATVNEAFATDILGNALAATVALMLAFQFVTIIRKTNWSEGPSRAGSDRVAAKRSREDYDVD